MGGVSNARGRITNTNRRPICRQAFVPGKLICDAIASQSHRAMSTLCGIDQARNALLGWSPNKLRLLCLLLILSGFGAWSDRALSAAVSPHLAAQWRYLETSSAIGVRAADKKILMYFLDEKPSEASLLNLGQDRIVLARVRLMGRAFYRGGREGLAPEQRASRETEVLGAKLEIREVLAGSIVIPPTVLVSFGALAPTDTRIPVPVTDEQIGREYFVAMYADSLGEWHLAGFATSRLKYLEWKQEAETFRSVPLSGKR